MKIVDDPARTGLRSETVIGPTMHVQVMAAMREDEPDLARLKRLWNQDWFPKSGDVRERSLVPGPFWAPRPR